MTSCGCPEDEVVGLVPEADYPQGRGQPRPCLRAMLFSTHNGHVDRRKLGPYNSREWLITISAIRKRRTPPLAGFSFLEEDVFPS